MKLKTTYLALLLAQALLAGPVSASVRIYSEATSTGPGISVRVYADISDPPIVSHTFKLFYDASQLRVVAAVRNEAIWYFHDGTQKLPQPAPVIVPVGEVLFVSGYMDARTPRTGITGNRVLLGTVSFARNSESVPDFNLSFGRNGTFANFVALDGTVLEARAGQVTMQAVAADQADRDLDGLNDKWEDKYFGNSKAFYADDSDRDGINNLDEAMMGSDPTDPRSALHLMVSERRGQLLLEWMSVDGRVYSLEGSKVLGQFETLKEGIKATPPQNSLVIERGDLPDTMFFRIQVKEDESRLSP